MEGAGKSTLASSLADYLRARGAEVVLTAEPGGDVVANGIRKLLLDSKNVISDKAELLLFEAARAQHVDVKIRPALERGAVVICDRFTDSSIAYQGFARGIDMETVKELNKHAASGLKPDLTILLDLPVESGLARQTEIDRVSSETIAFHEAVKKGFLWLASTEPERFVVIDASLSAEEVFRKAVEALESRDKLRVTGCKS